MATKNDKYHYINRVGLGQESWALERFIEDCVEHHMDDQPGKLAALRLTEYYKLIDRLNILPGGLAMISPVMVTTGAQRDGPVPVQLSGVRASERREKEHAPERRAIRVDEGGGDHRTSDTDNRAEEEDSQWGDL